MVVSGLCWRRDCSLFGKVEVIKELLWAFWKKVFRDVFKSLLSKHSLSLAALGWVGVFSEWIANSCESVVARRDSTSECLAHNIERALKSTTDL